VNLGHIRPQPQSLTEAYLRLSRPAKGAQRSAQGVVSVGMGGIDRQNLAIRCLSLLQPSGPVVNETPLKQFIDRRA
jgi:hypothetical protein